MHGDCRVCGSLVPDHVLLNVIGGRINGETRNQQVVIGEPRPLDDLVALFANANHVLGENYWNWLLLQLEIVSLDLVAKVMGLDVDPGFAVLLVQRQLVHPSQHVFVLKIKIKKNNLNFKDIL